MVSTVLTEMFKRDATSLLEFPSARSLTTSRSLLVNSFQFSEALNGNNHALLLRRYDDALASRYLRTVWLSFNTARQADATDLQVGDAQDTFVGSDG